MHCPASAHFKLKQTIRKVTNTEPVSYCVQFQQCQLNIYKNTKHTKCQKRTLCAAQSRVTIEAAFLNKLHAKLRLHCVRAEAGCLDEILPFNTKIVSRNPSVHWENKIWEINRSAVSCPS